MPARSASDPVDDSRQGQEGSVQANVRQWRRRGVMNTGAWQMLSLSISFRKSIFESSESPDFNPMAGFGTLSGRASTAESLAPATGNAVDAALVNHIVTLCRKACRM
jgi:hypothetical protein